MDVELVMSKDTKPFVRAHLAIFYIMVFVKILTNVKIVRATVQPCVKIILAALFARALKV